MSAIHRAFASAVIALALAACANAGPPLDSITLLHTNDIHSRLQPINAFGATCRAPDSEQGKCFGGSARLAAAIAAERAKVAAEGGASLLLDGGDQFQGSLFYTHYRGLAEVQVMNRLRYDAMAIGNHEFDNGPPVLATFAEYAEFPLLSANIDATREPALAGKFKPYVILPTKAGRIGVIGATAEETPTISSSGPGLTFLALERALPPVIAELRAQGVQRIVLLSHIGLERDREVARRVEGLDVIVGGHSHTLLSNAAAGARGPYPLVEKSPTGQDVLIVQTGAHGRYLGRLDVTFDAEGKPVRWRGDTIELVQSLPEDKDVLAMVAKLDEPLDQLRRTPVGEAAADFDQRSCRAGECAIGNLVADAVLQATAAQGTEVVLMNGGGLRAGIAAGKVNFGDVLSVLPFQNSVATLMLSGADLRAALEHGLSGIEQSQGRFAQVAGLRYVFDPRRPVGQRLIRVEVRERDGGFRPLDERRVYRVATNNFMRAGGDAYAVLRDKAIDPYDHGPNLEDVVAEHIRRHSPLRPLLDGRVSAQP